ADFLGGVAATEPLAGLALVTTTSVSTGAATGVFLAASLGGAFFGSTTSVRRGASSTRDSGAAVVTSTGFGASGAASTARAGVADRGVGTGNGISSSGSIHEVAVSLLGAAE